MDRIAPMSLAELEMVLDWAAAEGWNPGLDDAAAFHAADPAGFLLKTVGGKPAAAISVVNHSPEFAFLGLYIAAPAFRGQGHGLDIWKAGLAHAGDRTVGLDGVPDQQANYARSGFVRTGRTIRYAGEMEKPQGPVVRAHSDADTPHLLKADTEAEGYTRHSFHATWLAGTATRRTVLVDTRDGLGHATGRDCRDGIKIGPLRAHSADAARALIGELSNGGTAYIDVPETSGDLVKLVEAEGFAPVFETARMYLGTPPRTVAARFSSVSTLELG